MAAVDLYTKEDLIKRIAQCEKTLTWANGEYAWDTSFELQEYREILQQMVERDEIRSDLHLHSVGY